MSDGRVSRRGFLGGGIATAAARELETLSDGEVVADAMSVLRTIY